MNIIIRLVNLTSMVNAFSWLVKVKRTEPAVGTECVLLSGFLIFLLMKLIQLLVESGFDLARSWPTIIIKVTDGFEDEV